MDDFERYLNKRLEEDREFKEAWEEGTVKREGEIRDRPIKLIKTKVQDN